MVMCTKFRLRTGDAHYAIKKEGGYPVEISGEGLRLGVDKPGELERSLYVLESGLLEDEDPVCEVIHVNGETTETAEMRSS